MAMSSPTDMTCCWRSLVQPDACPARRSPREGEAGAGAAGAGGGAAARGVSVGMEADSPAPLGGRVGPARAVAGVRGVVASGGDAPVSPEVGPPAAGGALTPMEPWSGLANLTRKGAGPLGSTARSN